MAFAKRLGPEMLYYHTITKSGLPIHGATSVHTERKEEQRTIPGKMYVVVNFVFVQKE